jgi:protein-S-isoprenylcysteine O-methyltransferase Ste14
VSDHPPRWAVVGTTLAAPAFIGTVIVYVPYALSGWRPASTTFGGEPVRWIGVAMILLALPVLADFLLRFVREGHGTPLPLAPPRRLVTGGVFRYVRNPGYLAAIVALLGQALLLGSGPILIYAGAMALAFHLFVRWVEEPALHRIFGAAYDDYRRQVPRWLPRRPRPSP